MNVQWWQIALLTLVAFFTIIDGLSFDIGLGKPIQAGFIAGLILGDPITGLIIGGTLQLMILGIGTYGGASIPDYTTAAIIGTALGIGQDIEVAIAIAVPVGLLLIQLDILARFSNTFFQHRADKYVEKCDLKGIARMNLMGMIPWGLSRAIPVFLVLIFGQNFVELVLQYVPTWLMGGLKVAGGLLPIVGISILLRYLPSKKYIAYLLLGFALVAYFSLPMIGVATLGLVIALLTFKSKSERPVAAAVPVYNNIGEEDEYDEE